MDVVKLTWIDAQSLDFGLADLEWLKHEDLEFVKCSIVGFLVKETDDYFLLCSEFWESENKGKYFHLIPKVLVVKKEVIGK